MQWAAALVLLPPVGSARAIGDIARRFGGSQCVTGPAAAATAAGSLQPGRLSEPLVRPLGPGLKPWTWEGVPSPLLSHGNDPSPAG